MKTSLYRYYDEGDTLLYVGVSHNPFLREVQHEASEKDMTLVRHIEVEWFGTRELALLAECYAIRRENPLWNVARPKKRRKLRETPKKAMNVPKPPVVREAPKPVIYQLPKVERHREMNGPWLPKPHGPLVPWKRFAAGNVDIPKAELHAHFPAEKLEQIFKCCRAADCLFVGDDVDVTDELVARCLSRGVYLILPETVAAWDRTAFNEIDRDEIKKARLNVA